MENTAIITNIGDSTLTLTYGLISCGIIMALKSVYITIQANKNTAQMFEGGENPAGKEEIPV